MEVTPTNQFIGSKISLVSKSEIRYEGILYALDLQEATISLAKVRSFGTEDRPTVRPVAAKEEIYEFIIFRGSDIKGIDVIEPPEREELEDPAILQVKHQNVQVQQQERVVVERGVVVVEKPPQQLQLLQQQQPPQPQTHPHQQPPHQQQPRGRGGPNKYAPRGRGGGAPRGAAPHQHAPPRSRIQFEGEFDFEKANEELQVTLAKIKLVDEEKGAAGGGGEGEDKEEDECFYSKDNFFDNISCEALERQKGKQQRSDWRAERKLNAETFGLPAHHHHRGYSRGYYSGGYSRGGYNGRGYGGYRGGYRGMNPRGNYRGYNNNVRKVETPLEG